MKRLRFTDEQISYALKLADQGTPVRDVCRQFGIAEATFYVWRKKPSGVRKTTSHRDGQSGRIPVTNCTASGGSAHTGA
jgi:transposase-like protein